MGKAMVVLMGRPRATPMRVPILGRGRGGVSVSSVTSSAGRSVAFESR
jgi:hypothetical protein